MKRGFNIMSLFYASMAGVPLLLWLIAMTSATPSLHTLRAALAILAGIGSIIYGVIGFIEVFVHGR